MPAQIDFPMQRGSYGTHGAIIFQCLESDGTTPMNLTGATITMATTNLKENIIKTTADGSLRVDEFSNVTWLPTQYEVASIPLGRWARYYVEIVYSNGTDGLRFLEGYLVGRGA